MFTKLIKGIKNTLRGASEEAGEALTDKIRDGKFAIEDAKKEAQEFRRAIAGALTELGELSAKQNAAKAQADKYLDIAKKAKEANKKSDAQQALDLYNTNNEEFEFLSNEVKRHRKSIETTKAQLRSVDSQIRRASSSHAIQASRLKAAESRKAMAEAKSGLGDGNGLAALKDLEDAVRREEAEADALEEMSTQADEELEKKYAPDTKGLSLDDI